VEGGLRWRTEPLKADLAVSLVLDGRPHMSELRRYQWFATSVILAYGLIGAVMGLFLIQRVSKRLRRVADSARAVRELGTQVAIDDEGAPEEIRDVSEALQELLGNIRAESERNRVLLASMAHELRSPIQNLVGETEVALFQPRDNESYRRILESHLEEMRDLGDAIDNLVTICSKRDVPAGNEPEAFDLWDEAEIRLQRERSHARRRNVNLELVHDGNTRMEGDREGLLRALRNLAANAVEWSPDGGQVRVQLLGKDGQVIATVDDAGPGVPPEARLRIFDPFVRGPTASGRRIGYGLGLAIVKSAVDRQGGTVFVGESPLGGARFQMVLPKIPPEQPSAESVEGETLSA
jgi:two-component system heavy metal sensor histidine kinase CusS